jgi:hypothetical protein
MPVEVGVLCAAASTSLEEVKVPIPADPDAREAVLQGLPGMDR